jgi:pyridoxamine 5'-phosphate oxidase
MNMTPENSRNSNTLSAFEASGADPLALFDAWMTEARASESRDPEAAALSTVGAHNRPSSRMVLVKSRDETGFRFFTNADSRKGRELAANSGCALLFYWKSLSRQIRIEGFVRDLPEAESDAYFAARPRESQLGAWASMQSAPLSSRAALEEKLAGFEKRFEGAPVPRPPRWQGYALAPDRIEFWQEGAYRLHDRFVFSLEGGIWSKPRRLYP